ncbi:MAG TPA: acylneuraminate cytidylyltransferase family protein [Sedimenticola sp.]|nr:acylneuraminate cytidylyltransferase family protein [Sedimenticola sp.]
MPRQHPNVVALIPARSGSKRVPDKNVRRLAGHPLLAYTVSAALESGVFDRVLVSTDSPRYREIARHYGAEVPFLRPESLGGDHSPDIGWVRHALGWLAAEGRRPDCFSILRPTSPFRTAGTIRRAWGAFRDADGVDSLRAVEKCQQHPGKMWVVQGDTMTPLLPFFHAEGDPWHSSQYPTLPEIHVQNASLEIAWSRVVFEQHSIAGHRLMPFLTRGHEGFDLNSEYDWGLAEQLAASGAARLPAIPRPPYLSQRAAEPC